jgi:hypothetical protein
VPVVVPPGRRLSPIVDLRITRGSSDRPLLAIDTRDGLPGPTDAWLTRAGLARETSRLRRGTPAEVTDRIGRWREATGVSRLSLQILDLGDLDHVEFVAEQILPAA